MRLSARLANALLVAVLSLSTTLVAFAQVSDSDTITAEVACSSVSSIDIESSARFVIDYTTAVPQYLSIPNAVTLTLDMTCNWSTNFQVNGTVGNFVLQGTPIPPFATEIPAFRFKMSAGGAPIYYYGPSNTTGSAPYAAAPSVTSSLFVSGSTSTMIQNKDADTASPGVTVVTYQADLIGIPLDLQPGGTYVAPLTVELVVN